MSKGRYAIALLALLGPAVVARPQRRVTVAALVSCALVFATYAFYTVFDDWWYLRFLLPVLPVLVVAAVAVVLRAVTDRGRVVAAVVLAVTLGGWGVRVATARHVFDLQRLEARFVRTGEYAARDLPADAVVLAVQQSGSIRFYAGLPTIAWDAVPAGTLDALVERLQASGHHVFAALEDAEAQPFRDRFAGQACGALSERPIAEIASAVRVRIYRLSCAARSTSSTIRRSGVDSVGLAIVFLSGSARSAGHLLRTPSRLVPPQAEALAAFRRKRRGVDKPVTS